MKNETYEFEGKVAMVTGASGGIGSAIALRLASKGADIAVAYVSEAERAECAAAAIRDLGRQALLVQLDQGDPESIERAVTQVGATLGGMDILVNNAAWNIGVPFTDLEAMTPELWDRLMNINLRGPFLLVRAAAKMLRAKQAGHVVNISSNGGIAPSSSSIAYSASKAGLIHLTRCLAVALAPDVAVNCIAPGVVPGTRMSARMPAEVFDAEREAALLQRVPAAEEIADFAAQLCASKSITGQTIVIDGGMIMAMH